MRKFPVFVLISSLFITYVANGSEKSDEKVKAKEQAQDICVALTIYKMDRLRWPSTEEGLNVLTFPALNDYGESGDPYLSVIEKDAWGNDYIYKQHKKRFILLSKGKDGVLNTSDDIGPNVCYPDWVE